jgi:hypothetical protein
MAFIVSRIEPSINSDGSFSIVLQTGDDELSAVIPRNLVLPLLNTLQSHFIQVAFDQSKGDLATTGTTLPAITIAESKTAKRDGETNICARTPEGLGLS